MSALRDQALTDRQMAERAGIPIKPKLQMVADAQGALWYRCGPLWHPYEVAAPDEPDADAA